MSRPPGTAAFPPIVGDARPVTARRVAAQQYNDPAIAAVLGLSPHQVRVLRKAYGISGQRPGRPRKDRSR